MSVQLKVYPLARPKTRGECGDMPRPCPFLSCRYHLAHRMLGPKPGPKVAMSKDVAEAAVAEHGSARSAARAIGVHPGTIGAALKRHVDDDAIADHVVSMVHSCALDVADNGAVSTATIGTMLGMTRQGVDYSFKNAITASSEHDGAQEMSDALASLDREPFDLMAHDGR